jgi:hypothetical protein
MDELFLSLDVETGGPIPGKNPMLELGAAAYRIDGTVVGTHSVSIAQDGWEMDPATLKWWHQPANFQAFQRISEAVEEPRNAMLRFSMWLDSLNFNYSITPVAYPACFDYMFVYWYLMYYIGTANPLSFSCLDLKSYVCAARKRSYRNTVKGRFPKRWFHHGLPHTHSALDDALEQGFIFVQAYRQNHGLALLDPDHNIGLR